MGSTIATTPPVNASPIKKNSLHDVEDATLAKTSIARLGLTYAIERSPSWLGYLLIIPTILTREVEGGVMHSFYAPEKKATLFERIASNPLIGLTGWFGNMPLLYLVHEVAHLAGLFRNSVPKLWRCVTQLKSNPKNALKSATLHLFNLGMQTYSSYRMFDAFKEPLHPEAQEKINEANDTLTEAQKHFPDHVDSQCSQAAQAQLEMDAQCQGFSKQAAHEQYLCKIAQSQGKDDFCKPAKIALQKAKQFCQEAEQQRDSTKASCRATCEKIKTTFHKAAQQNHFDKSGKTSDAFTKLSAAYDLLKNHFRCK